MDSDLRDRVMKLPAEERIQLAMDLWDSLSEDELPLPTPEQLEEAHRRLDDYRKNPDSAIPAEEALEWLRSRYK
jgi:putative addiction module component (TIGR02574 family)